MKKSLSLIFQLFVSFLPWRLRRWCLNRFWKYEIHPSARIGFSWIFPKYLKMAEKARIGHFNVAIHLESISMGVKSTISRGNWITGFPKGDTRHFAHQKDREPCLILGDHSAITKNHHFDCTASIEVGKFTTIAGYASQFLTHSIDLQECRQHSAPIHIGSHCFVGTNVVVLGGATLPDRSVLGAKSLLHKSFKQTDFLYGGVPVKPLKAIDATYKYFSREDGFVR